jgi:glutamate racemase
LFAQPEVPTRLLLGCTHYPLLRQGIASMVPPKVEILDQGDLVAERLADWLRRHPEMEQRLSRRGQRRFATTDDPAWFARQGEPVMGRAIAVERVRLRPWAAGDGERS